MQTTDFEFKAAHPDVEERGREAERIKAKYPNRLPIVVEIAPSCRKLISIDKRKYLVPDTLTLGQLRLILEKRLTLKSSEALFIFVGNQEIPPISISIAELYRKHKDTDSFLYVILAVENTFGY